MSLRWLAFPILLLASLAVIALAIGGFVLLLAYPKLPSVESLSDYRPKIPLRIYTADGFLIGEFGEERRSVVRIETVPALLKNAILAAEDERFYQHSGVDYVGVFRAAYSNLVTGGKRQGASTITMQVARNFFLSSEKTMIRKVYEALLAFRIEASLSKDQILELYINQIYLGQRAYGFAAAAQIYFGKTLQQLSPAEAAMLAGLPKAPSLYNPVVNPKRARQRQLYVLRRMSELGHLDAAQLEDAQKVSLMIKRERNDYAVHAEYVAEMVRQMIFERYPDDVYTKGFRVYTTILKKDQEAAYQSLRKALLDYDRRHGYRGPEGYVELTEDTDEAYDEALSDYADSDELLPGLVLAAGPRQVKLFHRGGETVTIAGDGLKFAARGLDEKTAPNKRLRRGAIVRIMKDDKGAWQITQLPEVEGGFVSASPQDGAVKALVGGFDFGRNKFNHVTQAWRQPGSGFKPFIYSAALEKGFTPATIVNDAPVVVDPFLTGGQVWEPKNYDGKYEGPMGLRTGLARSKNMISIRVLQSIGTQYAQDYVKRFGFDADKHPPYLTMALGAGSATMWQMLRGYGVFANGGYKVEPYLVSRIVDDRGTLLAQAQPQMAGDETLRAIDARNAFLMDSMMRDVVRYGTAARANALGRQDLAGKTGTTNDFVDAWFNGYQATLVGIAWVGFDQPRKLGNGETGGVTALPIWTGFMSKALKNVAESTMPVPEGVVSVKVNEAGRQSPDGKPEYFMRETLPPEASAAESSPRTPDEVKSQLF
ncbi:MAG: penicillin-binding protein 1A [Betaproteobacteria bacterium]|nr:penicillin-binding protein 1A [Betaproteobacteria bacterium]